VTVLDVVPTHELGSPAACCIEVVEAARRERRPVLRGAKQALDERVVVADA